MRCHVIAPRRLALNIVMAKKQILVQAGDAQEIDLTGDEVGVVEDTLNGENGLHRVHNIPPAEQGRVECPERDASEANPPMGSKKHRLLHPEAYDAAGLAKADKKTAKAKPAA